MSNYNSATRERIREAAKQLGIKGAHQTLASRIKDVTVNFLRKSNAVVSTAGVGALGLESFGSEAPVRNKSFDAVRDADVNSLVRDLHELGMAPRHMEQVAESVLNLFDGSYNTDNILRNGNIHQDSHQPLSRVVGRTSAAALARLDTGLGLEAFGDDINRLATDDRLTMSLIIMRPWDNIMDKALARVSESSPVVTVRVPSPEAWDWATTQQANSTVESRSGSSNTYRLRDLYRNPTPVNSAAKKIVPLTANDSGSVLWNSTTTYYKTAKDVSLLDLARDTTRITYDKVDRTDLVADGGILDGVIVKLVATVSSVVTTEYFLINTRPFDLSMFVVNPSSKNSGQRQVIMEAVLPISSATKTYNGSNSTIAAALTDAKIRLRVRITASLDIKTGVLYASGTASTTLVQLANGTAISGTTNTMYGSLAATVDAYSVDLYWDEENQRKANLAVWVNYYEQQFVVPRSRIYFTEYSLTQDVDDNAVSATSSIVALGNGRRGLDIIVNALSDTATGLAYATANPEIVSHNSMDEQSFAGALVKPTVVTTTLDYGIEELNTLNESTRLSEIHGRFRARLLSMATQLFAKSLMLNQYKPGETPVLKAWVHSSIADLVIGILDYHPDLKDKAALATGADYSMTLPNGYRLDVVKSNFDCLQQRIYIVPVIESDPASIISAASIRDCGTVTTNYTPTNNGAVVRRVATTTREIVFMSNRVGLMIKVQGLQIQLGAFDYTAIPLNADYTTSLTV
jgi:hypothetical protein